MKYINILKIGILTLLGAIFLASCGTTTPVPNGRETVKYSENSETAGLQGFNDDGSIEINSDARSEYNSYVQKYGQYLLPPISTDYGIKPQGENYSITDQAFEDWAEMRLMEKRERINRSK